MQKIIVASTNPVKINSALGGFLKMFPETELDAEGISTPSGVSDQPMSDAETLKGATNRAQNAKLTLPTADFWVGLEGGVEDINGEMQTVVWAVVLSKDQMGKAKAGAFMLPPKMAELIRGGMEMGHADDQIFGTVNSKQKMGAVGLLTKGVIDRTALYEVGIILALIPFVNPELYSNDNFTN